MRVALITSLLGGGPVEHAIVLTAGLVGAGAAVQAICASEPLAARLAAAGADVALVPLESARDLPHALEIRRLVRGADVVHAQDRRAGLWTRLLPRPARQALVYTIHGLPDPYLPPPAGPARPGWRAVLAYRGLDVALGRRADCVVTPTSAMRQALVHRVGWPAHRVTVVPNGVAIASPAGEGTAVGTLSVLEPVKGLPVFLQAAQQLASERPGLPLVLFGSGSQEGALREQAVALGLGGRVEFAGHVATRDALERMAVLALPSLMENGPMAMLEAMAAGVAVVASRVGGIPELAPEGTALLVPPGDPDALAAAIGALLDDPARRRAQAAHARVHVEREASQTVMTRRMLAVYDRAIATRRSAA